MIIKFFITIILGVVGMWVAIPFGLTMKLNPVIISLSTTFGAILGIILILSIRQHFRMKYMERYFKPGIKSRTIFLNKFWKRYGTIGFGLIAPLIIGAHIGALLGIILGVPERGLLVWLSIGTFIWCTVFTIIGTLGLVGIEFLV